ncbi:MAG: FmdB family transcriptional regulator [Chloroflexi bacterium]|nr:FmdB family transcriptional regulator [Chloroflexota bacterium]
MPTYEYRCKGCGHQFDVVHRVSDPAPESCPVCGEGPIQKVFTSVGIIFKGSGFHVNDYRKSGEKRVDAAAEGKPENGEKPADKTDEKPSEKQSEKAGDSGSKTAEPGAAPSGPAPAPKPDTAPAAPAAK